MVNAAGWTSSGSRLKARALEGEDSRFRPSLGRASGLRPSLVAVRPSTRGSRYWPGRGPAQRWRGFGPDLGHNFVFCFFFYILHYIIPLFSLLISIFFVLMDLFNIDERQLDEFVAANN